MIDPRFRPDFERLVAEEELDDDGLVTPAIWYTHRWRELALGWTEPSSELARFAATVLGPDARVHDDGRGRVYVEG
ncbi:MAG TPA: hypothetical protein VL652_22975 [Kutzneria sp.]|jgi:hypothetical protein|nr:hypothetical protein [Kutzneria sp.]